MALLYPAGQQFFDSNGDPVGSGFLYVYANGTTSEVSIYSDPDLSTGALSNPITLDSSGRLTTHVFLDGSSPYTVRLTTSASAELWSRDDTYGWGDTLFHNDAPVLFADGIGVIVRDPAAAGTSPEILLERHNGADVARILGGGGAGICYFRGEQNSINMQIDSLDSGGTRTVIFLGDPDGAASLYYDGTARIATSSTGAAVTGTTIALSSKPGTYTPTNVSTDRSFDANSTTTDELADVLGTLIADLQTIGLIG